MVLEINQLSEFLQFINSHAKVIVDFYSTWCPPCRLAAPQFQRFSMDPQYAEFRFISTNVDLAQSIANQYNVEAVPTFKFFINGNCQETVRGCDLRRIESLLKTHSATQTVSNAVKVLATENNCETFENTRDILIKLIRDILKEPMNESVRSLSLQDDVVTNHLLPTAGAFECILELGFQEGDDCFELPITASLDCLRRIEQQLLTVQWMKTSMQRLSTSQQRSPVKLSMTLGIPNKEMLQELLQMTKMNINYENKEYQATALKIMKENVLKKQSSQEQILDDLLRWFREDYFTWVDKPSCRICHTSKNCCFKNRFPNLPHSLPQELLLDDELQRQLRAGDCGSVEVYECSECRLLSYFPRFNDPCYLLQQSPRGRCGEWANAFCLCLVASGVFPRVRYIRDFKDHVWCEVWMQLDGESCSRWVHCDPCEQIYDSPLVYEKGWRKPLDYVFAVEVYTGLLQDVTWRYTSSSFNEVFRRRTKIGEDFLSDFLSQNHRNCLAMWESKRYRNDLHEAPVKLELVRQHLSELASFMALNDDSSSRKLKSAERRCRQTGSEGWRLQRGEYHQSCADNAVPVAKNIWDIEHPNIRLTEEEMEACLFHIQYNCAKNAYRRLVPAAAAVATAGGGGNDGGDGSDCVRGWQSMLFRARNVQRKREPDWHMCYLARKPTSHYSSEGYLEWRLGLQEALDKNVFLNEVCVLCSFATFKSGKCSVSMRFYVNDDSKLDFPITGFTVIKKSDMGESYRSITAIQLSVKLSSDQDDGDTSWQTAQLFRQKDSDEKVFPFEWKVTFHK